MKHTELEIAKILARPKIKKQREYAINSPLNGFDVATPEDRENIQGAIDYYDTLTLGGDLVWTMDNGSEKVVTLEDLKGAKDGYVLRKAQIFADYQNKKAAIEAATSVAELNEIIGE